MKAVFNEDSLFLKNSGLIDYSVFVVEIDRNKIITGNKQNIQSLAYNAVTKEYVMKEANNLD